MPTITGWAKKVGHTLVTIILSKSEPIKFFFTGKFLGKCVVKWMVKLPSFFAYVATLLCETSSSAKQATNDKIKGSVTTYLRCDGVVNNLIKKGLLLSLRVKK